MNRETRIEKTVQQLVARFGEISSIWLCGSRANPEGAEGVEKDDWDLVVFGDRKVAEELELDGNFLGRDFDLKLVDPATGELKRLWKSDAWEDFASWCWTERSPTEAEYHSARFGDQLVMMGGEWVEGGELTVVRKRALRLWPAPAHPVPDAAPYVN
jgi:hypothetical protein